MVFYVTKMGGFIRRVDHRGLWDASVLYSRCLYTRHYGTISYVFSADPKIDYLSVCSYGIRYDFLEMIDDIVWSVPEMGVEDDDFQSNSLNKWIRIPNYHIFENSSVSGNRRAPYRGS